MTVIQRFTHREVARILGVTSKQLSYWERLGLARPAAGAGEKFYGFDDLIGLRAVKELTEQGLPPHKLRRALAAAQTRLSKVEAPLAELRIRPHGHSVVVEHDGARFEPFSGQLILPFDGPQPQGKIRALPGRSPDELFALALELEAQSDAQEQAVEIYRSVLAKKPDWSEAQLNLGILLYERGELKEAAQRCRCAVELEPANALAHFNLGTILDELGDLAGACHHLREAVSLRPDYADAHYNLALVAEKLGRREEARGHWRRYLELDPASPWSSYAQQRLLTFTKPGHSGTDPAR